MTSALTIYYLGRYVVTRLKWSEPLYTTRLRQYRRGNDFALRLRIFARHHQHLRKRRRIAPLMIGVISAPVKYGRWLCVALRRDDTSGSFSSAFPAFNQYNRLGLLL